MLFWHSQPEHYWPTASEHYQNPPTSIYRDPLQLPFLKQEDHPPHSQMCPAFQCVLCAPSSPAVKLHEESLTYLNQGQSYEIRMLSNWKGENPECRRLLKSVVRVVFHDRRLQYSEREQLDNWQLSHPGDRILDLDVPLSVGVMEPLASSNTVNTVEFLWDPFKRTSVFIQVHCISTEFTQKKNGGEKGAPFRVQVDTYKGDCNGGFTEHIYSSSCQIKVFKPKGADRKLKTDREKVEKRSPTEREKYQPPSEHTVLTECAPWPDIDTTQSSLSPGLGSPRSCKIPTPERICTSPVCPSDSSTECAGEGLSPSASILDTQQWLVRNRFSNYCRTFSNFTGADLLKLCRGDLTQICGVADGIRLEHALTARSVRPRLTLYITAESPPKNQDTTESRETAQLYQEVYLEDVTAAELTNKLADLFSVPANHIQRISKTGPHGIHILLSDMMVRNMTDESCFTATLQKVQNPDGYHCILR
ncbi:transcription factor CP2-like protein 1 [Discoglossus pictus]